MEPSDYGLSIEPSVSAGSPEEPLPSRFRAGCIRLARLGFFLGAISAGAAWAEQSLLVGTWDGVDRASQARYGRIWVTNNFIQWSGSRFNPGCRVRYSLVSEKSGNTYPDALDVSTPLTPMETDDRPRYSIFRITLQKRRCIGQRSALQFAIPTNTPNRAELITYDRQGKPASWGNLARLHRQ